MKRIFNALRLKLVHFGWLSPQRNVDFPELLETTPIDRRVKSLPELSEFIKNTDSVHSCFSMLNVIQKGTGALSYPIKDWAFTIEHHKSPFLEGAILKKLDELLAFEQKEHSI